MLQKVDGDVMCCAVHAAAKKGQIMTLAAGTNAGTVHLYTMSGEDATQLQHTIAVPDACESQWVLSVALSPGGSSLAVAVGGQGAVLLFSIDAAGNGASLRACTYSCGGSMVWAAWLSDELVITSAAAKALHIWCPGQEHPDACLAAVSEDAGVAAVRAIALPTLEMRGMFASSGSFGSADGVGGAGSVLRAQASATGTGSGRAAVVIGDQGGRLYLLGVEL
eukprot:COSAG01_NODE_2295_length_7967_cov_3.577021_7_plen_222_part_00